MCLLQCPFNRVCSACLKALKASPSRCFSRIGSENSLDFVVMPKNARLQQAIDFYDNLITSTEERFGNPLLP